MSTVVPVMPRYSPVEPVPESRRDMPKSPTLGLIGHAGVVMPRTHSRYTGEIRPIRPPSRLSRGYKRQDRSVELHL